MLPTGDPLGTFVTTLSTPFCRLDGLAIDTTCAGFWLPTGSPLDSTSESVIDGLPGSISFPHRKVVVDSPPWGKIVGQRSPDTTIAVAVEDSINHAASLSCVAAHLCWPRQEGLQHSPLLTCQSLYAFLIPFSTLRLWRRPPGRRSRASRGIPSWSWPWPSLPTADSSPRQAWTTSPRSGTSPAVDPPGP